MTSINRASALAALIRARLATQKEAKQPLAEGHLSPGTALQAQAPNAPGSQSNIERQSWVLRQVKHVSPDHPRNKRKAFGMFLEAVLGQEFGRELIGSSSFDRLVRQVLVQMEDDAELALAMDKAGQ